MNVFHKTAAAVLVGLLVVGTLAVLGADDSPARTAPEAAWQKAIAAWKSEKVSEPADNSYCDVCHLNYQQEKLAKTHKKAGVGCETCHGISDKHSEDEDNMVPPDIMYPQPRVKAFCMGCHEKGKLVKEDNHDDIFSKDADPEDTCTDCHGEKHRLKVRTRKWDKATGKLTWYDGVRMMQEKPKK